MEHTGIIGSMAIQPPEVTPMKACCRSNAVREMRDPAARGTVAAKLFLAPPSSPYGEAEVPPLRGGAPECAFSCSRACRP